MPIRHAFSNEDYVRHLAAAVAANRVMRPAAMFVLEGFSFHVPPRVFAPRRVRGAPLEPDRWQGTNLEDALAAVAMLEARALLVPPSDAERTGVWQQGAWDAYKHILPLTPSDWVALFERCWTLLSEHLPHHGRRVQFSENMVAQLLAMGGETKEGDTPARQAFAQWARIWQLQPRAMLDGAIVYEESRKYRVSGSCSAESDAQWMRDNLTGHDSLIRVTSDGVCVHGADGSRRALQLSEQAVGKALAHDAARTLRHNEVLVAQRLPDGTGIVMLEAQRDYCDSAEIVDTAVSIISRLLEQSLAGQFKTITNRTVRQAAADELQFVADVLTNAVERCSPHMAMRANQHDGAQRAVARVRAASKRAQSTHAYATHAVRNTGVHWTKALAAVSALPGIPQHLTRENLRCVVPPTAWAYHNVPLHLHPLYTLLAPLGVRPSAAILAAHRYHACPTTRADARHGLAQSAVLAELVRAPTRRVTARTDCESTLRASEFSGKESTGAVR